MNDKTVLYVNIEQLELDRENPRLPFSLEKSESNILNYIAFSTNIEDLMNAISSNGYFGGEPLIVIPHKNKKYIVAEGNRRLTAVKLLNDVSLSSHPSIRMRDVSRKTTRIKQLPVIAVRKREDVLPYLGFRHIAGIKQWEPLAKARYIKQLFDTTDETPSTMERYKQVAKNIGSRADYIRRSLDGLAVFNNIEEEGFFQIAGLDESSFKFSVLTTALSSEAIAAYVGVVQLTQDGNYEYTHPIVDDGLLNKKHTKELSKWMYEKDELGRTVLGESRNLKYLAAVLTTPNALESLRAGSTLDYAYRLSKGSDKEFMRLLYNVEADLKNAAGLVANIEYQEESYDVAKEISNLINQIGRMLKSKKNNEDDW